MLNLFTVCLSNDMKEDKKIAAIVKSLEQRVGLLEKKVALTKKMIEEKQHKNQIVAEDLALLAENDMNLKNYIDASQAELEALEENIKKK